MKYDCLGIEHRRIFPSVDARLQNYKRTWSLSDEKHGDEESRNLIIIAKTSFQLWIQKMDHCRQNCEARFLGGFSTWNNTSGVIPYSAMHNAHPCFCA